MDSPENNNIIDSGNIEVIDLTSDPNVTINIDVSFGFEPEVVYSQVVEDEVEDDLAEDVVEDYLAEDLVEDDLAEEEVEVALAEDEVEIDLAEDSAEGDLAEDEVEIDLAEDSAEGDLAEDEVEVDPAEVDPAGGPGIETENHSAVEYCLTTIAKKTLEIIGDADEILTKIVFDENSLKYEVIESPKIDCSVTWTYRRGQIVNNAPWTLIVMDGEEYLDRILTYRDQPEDIRSIKHFLCSMREKIGRDIIFMVYNLANFIKNERTKDAKQYRKNFKDRFEGVSSETNAQMDDRSKILSLGITELQDLRITLEIEIKLDNPDWKFHIEFFEKTEDFVKSLASYCLSMEKLRVKQNVRASTGIDWALDMDKERAVDPTKSDEDLVKLWVTQLQQFSQVTVPIAKAIAAEYPSPCALIDQYRTLTTAEAENLLSELYAQRNLKRQIGPNISKRIHCFLTSADPDIHVGFD